MTSVAKICRLIENIPMKIFGMFIILFLSSIENIKSQDITSEVLDRNNREKNFIDSVEIIPGDLARMMNEQFATEGEDEGSVVYLRLSSKVVEGGRRQAHVSILSVEGKTVRAVELPKKVGVLLHSQSINLMRRVGSPYCWQIESGGDRVEDCWPSHDKCEEPHSHEEHPGC